LRTGRFPAQKTSYKTRVKYLLKQANKQGKKSRQLAGQTEKKK